MRETARTEIGGGDREINRKKLIIINNYMFILVLS